MKNLDEIIDFINETGDKCVILHQEKGAYVVLPLAEYKKMYTEKAKNEAKEALNKPDSDVRLYEVPRLETENDKYYPEPLD